MTNVSSDVVVIGSGVIGASVACELARDGWTVTVVDRSAGPGQGSTSASSAVIRFNYSTWTGVAAAWESHYHWEDWREHLQAPATEALARAYRTGLLVFDSPQQDQRKVVDLFSKVGVPYEIWDTAKIKDRMPQLDTGRYYPPKPVTSDAFWEPASGDLSGYWTPDAGFVDDPALAAHNLMSAARRLGATFRFRSTVTSIRREHDKVAGVQLADGSRIDAPIVVNVAGPNSGQVNELAGVGDDFNVRTAPMRQEVHQVPAPTELGVPAPMITDLDLGTYSRGTPSGQIVVGGTEPECDRLQWLSDPDEFQHTVSTEVYEAQLYRLARRMPDLPIPNAPRGVVGIYDVSDDWVPIYDRTDLSGFYVAIGTSGNQFKNAPVVGRFMAELIKACENGHPHDVDPVQVTLERTGHVADLQHYSRLREVNSESSFSVMG